MKFLRLIPVFMLAMVASAYAEDSAKAKDSAPPKTENKAEQKVESKVDSKLVTTTSGLKYQDQVVGSGAEAVKGKSVKVHYTGWLDVKGEKGTKFDSSVDRGDKFDFNLGAGQVIQGWDEGVAGMKVGGKRTLMIPSKLAYGSRGAGGVIPPNADLIFDVELFEVH